jgi:hypothetical protein
MEDRTVLLDDAAGSGRIGVPDMIREYLNPPTLYSMRYLAQADKQTNQKTALHTHSQARASLPEASAECMKGVRKFPYEP